MQELVSEATLGHRVRIVDAGGLRLTESFYPAGQTTDDHVHTATSLVFGLEGLLTQRHAGRSGDLLPQRWLVLPHDVLHSDRVGSAGCACLFLTLRAPESLDLGAASAALRAPGFLDDARAAGLGLQLRRELWLDDRYQVLALEGLAFELIAEIGRYRAPDAPPRVRRLARVRECLHERFLDPPTIAELAAAAEMRPAYLAREFSRVYGSTIAGYTRQLRIQWAAGELAGSDRPIASIACEAGFVDQSHLTRVFRRAFGVTPARYRAEHGLYRSIRIAG
jgi:AraC family transcriptional regulator